VSGAEDPDIALGPEAELGAGKLGAGKLGAGKLDAGKLGAGEPRPSALAISLTAHVHASGLNGVLAAKEPATTAEAVPTSMPCEMRSRRLSATPASAAATRMLTSRGASGSRSFRRFAIIVALDRAGTP
jgi:hypothetical protein